MSSQLFPSHDNRLIASLSSTRDKHSARQIRRTRDKTIFGVPLELRIPRVFLARVYFSCPITLAVIRGYSPCWTVTLLLAFLAVTITFYFNKIQNLTCLWAPIKRLYHAGPRKNALEIVKNYVEMYCSSYAGAPGPEQGKLVKIRIFRSYFLPLQLLIELR